MATSNPAFNSPAFSLNQSSAIMHRAATPSSEQLDELYGKPSATPEQTDRMTYEDTIQKAVGAFALVALGAAVGWFVPFLTIPAAIVGFVLALVNIFKKKPSAGLVLAYSGVQGIFAGGISVFFEALYPGIAIQALLGTAAVFVVTLLLFRSGKIRASKKATKVFLIAMIGYAVFSLINVGMMLFGATDSAFGLRSAYIPGTEIPIGLVLGILVVLLAAYSLVLDFDQIQKGVENGAPRMFAWRAVFGIVLTVIWLYIEILRMLAILRGE
ncbi:MAG: Bax inhibitor-1/YccA family protein [Actinobacteria bacterium]|nr:Bax inhibitor-1/YccA family protein [Actinomycetota bacterium]MBU1608094.1 Bax inhibitor-1/YccA family protein [Actinomycetota bacterium]MBU2315056.1 Bax inhibitor-1/YccA family protein [Actinomycetota bacterium]MBU2386265.1 Bax inhibitor-1/YccA family protein [Actinomycetota bacterium]